MKFQQSFLCTGPYLQSHPVFTLATHNNNKTTFDLYNQHSHEIGLRLAINNFLKTYFHTIYIEAQINVELLFYQIRD
jgi:hypothetical protein